jgi:glycosyltransferase involved in cell wall biosynthesis
VKPASTPLVSIVLAAHDAAATIAPAVASVLRQSERDLEVVVVDDGSSDATPELLDRVRDERLVVVRNDERLGLAASLNRGVDHARGRWLARLDADDVALERRLERQLARVRSGWPVAVLGTAVLELDDGGRLGAVHVPPVGDAAVRWHALFGAPFFHPTVLVDRNVLDSHRLRYDPAYAESEDYDLWARLLAVAEGDNLDVPLVLRRVHPGQASKRRGELQRSFQRTVALREIGALAPELGADGAELAFALGGAGWAPPDRRDEAADALTALVDAFARRHGEARAARRGAARALARVGLRERALRLDPLLPLEVAAARARRRSLRHATVRQAAPWLRSLVPDDPVRVVVVSPEPTPYRSPLFDRVAERPEVDLTVVYAAQTVAGRTWEVVPKHRAIVLDGVRVPGVRPLLRHDYPVTPGLFRVLREARPDVVVAHGWSTFPAQGAIAWSRSHHVPYLLLVSSHDAVERAWWRRAVRRPVVPAIAKGAWGAFALGTLSRDSLVANGVSAERVRLFANTIDVGTVAARADELASSREALRAGLGLEPGDVAVLSAGRLVPEKGLDVLVRAVAAAGDPRLALVVAGEGPERERLETLAGELGVRLRLAGDLAWERLLEAYVAADVFALLSLWEPWGVVVNEAAACGKPLVLSDRVGAAADLLRDGENGAVVPAGDVAAAGAALARLAANGDLRLTQGARSLELVQGWGYGPSVESFVRAVTEAAGRVPT